MKNKKYLKAIISFGVGAILLATAVFANYENAGGYSVCKNALKKVAFAENFSMDYTAEVTLDNESYSKTWGSYKINVDGNPSRQTERTDENRYWTYFMRSTTQDKAGIHQYYNSLSANPEDNGYITDAYYEAEPIATAIGNDPETGEKFIGFAETLSDALVGDLKNSFVLVSDEGGVKNYNVTLSKEQLPSYVASGVSLITSLIRQENSVIINSEDSPEDDPFFSLFGSGDPYIKDVNVNMSVDDNGNPVQISGIVNVVGYDTEGGEHTLSVNVSLDFYHFGETEIERISENEIAELDDFRRPYGSEMMETSIGGADGPTAVYIK